MAYRVEFTDTFVNSSKRTIKWLRKEWSDTSAKSFREKLSLSIEQIMKYPTAGKKSVKNKDVRSILVTKHNKLYYRISGKTIILLELFETKQNPKKNNYE
jgi:plasmid stabilization system protein ParE